MPTESDTPGAGPEPFHPGALARAWAWLKKWGGLLFGVLAAVLLALVGGGWLWRRREAELGKARDEAEIAKATAEMERLRAVRAEVEARVGEKDEAIEVLDGQIADQKRRAVEAAGEGEGLEGEALEAAFRRVLGG